MQQAQLRDNDGRKRQAYDEEPTAMAIDMGMQRELPTGFSFMMAFYDGGRKGCRNLLEAGGIL
jgi:hypothetical protein